MTVELHEVSEEDFSTRIVAQIINVSETLIPQWWLTINENTEEYNIDDIYMLREMLQVVIEELDRLYRALNDAYEEGEDDDELDD